MAGIALVFVVAGIGGWGARGGADVGAGGVKLRLRAGPKNSVFPAQGAATPKAPQRLAPVSKTRAPLRSGPDRL